jgi:beta-lactamase class A
VSAGKLGGVLHAAGADGWVHARAIDGDGERGLGEDELVVQASIFKIGVALELFRQAETGRIDAAERIRLRPGESAPGPTGLSNARDEVELSLRDCAYLMLTISDNAATDSVLDRVGIDHVSTTLRRLGLHKTTILGGCRALLDSVAADLGYETWRRAEEAYDEMTPSELAETARNRPPLRATNPDTATRTTPREATALLSAIWRDEAGPKEACAEVRRLMAQQLTRHRIASAFPSTVLVSAKSGSLFGEIRNEAGVVEYPDGGRYAVAVFTRSLSRDPRQPAIDAAIGETAQLAVELLRA